MLHWAYFTEHDIKSEVNTTAGLDYFKSDFISKFLSRMWFILMALIRINEPFHTTNRGYVYSSPTQNSTLLCQHTARVCTSAGPALTSAAQRRCHRTEKHTEPSSSDDCCSSANTWTHNTTLTGACVCGCAGFWDTFLSLRIDSWDPGLIRLLQWVAAEISLNLAVCIWGAADAFHYVLFLHPLLWKQDCAWVKTPHPGLKISLWPSDTKTSSSPSIFHELKGFPSD